MSRELLERYADVESRLAKACERCGRKRSEVTLVAVSKFHPASAIAAVAGAGQIDFGENYLQEAQEKMTALGQSCPHIRWHMIGHLQSRKAAHAAGAFAMIHTLDSQKLADALERKLAQQGAVQKALIEVNIADEPQKSGISPAKLPELAEYVLQNCPGIDLRGLMCLPPVFDSGDAARPYFARLRGLRDSLESATGRRLPELSMGMSGDFAAAVAEGASIVRIGTDIFGARPSKL